MPSNGQPGYYPEFLKKANHPCVCVWHFAVKIGAVVCYLLGGFFSDRYVAQFLSVVLLCAVDFWIVKNVTGRILVGLRWWNEMKEDGTDEWIFESLKVKNPGGVDSNVFWFVLYASPSVWTLFLIIGLLSLNFASVTLCFCALMMSATNLFGYIKCSKDHNKKVKTFFLHQAAKQMANQ